MAEKTQISSPVPAQTRAKFDEILEKTGLKQAELFDLLFNLYDTRELKTTIPERMSSAFKDIEKHWMYMLQGIANMACSSDAEVQAITLKKEQEVQELRDALSKCKEELKLSLSKQEQYDRVVQERDTAQSQIQKINQDLERLTKRNDELTKLTGDYALKLKDYDTLQAKINEQKVQIATLENDNKNALERVQELKELNKSQQANFDKMLEQLKHD